MNAFFLNWVKALTRLKLRNIALLVSSQLLKRFFGIAPGKCKEVLTLAGFMLAGSYLHLLG